MERICEFCGAAYTPKSAVQKYCCHDCHNKAAWKRQKLREKPRHICKVCGEAYESGSRTTGFCSHACAALYRSPECAVTEEIDPLTAYCCQKWYREGMTPHAIAQMTHRPLRLVQKALAVKLGKEDYNMMAEYRR